MLIGRTEAIARFEGVGYTNVDKWNAKRMRSKLTSTVKMLEDEDLEIDDKELREWWEKVAALVADGEEVKVVKDEDVEEEATAVADAPDDEGPEDADGAGEPEAEKKKPAKKTKKETGTSDRFGNRLGTQVSRINECISEKPTTAKEIAEKLSARLSSVSGHLGTLKKRGFVVATKEGFVLAD